MSGRALDRFWRGVREPWELLAQMRHDRPLWRRYWRTVLIQAALSLVMGLAVFWLFKHGQDAWNDAFGPEEVQEASVSPVVGEPPGRDGAEAPPASSPTGTEKAPARAPQTPRTLRSGKSVAPGPPGPVPPPPPAPARPGEPPATAVPPSAAPEAIRHGAAATADEDEADEVDDASGKDDQSLEASIEQKVKALQEAPPEERGKRTAELVAAAIQQAKKEASRAQTRAGKTKDRSPEEDAADELQQDREDLGDKIGELTLAAEVLAHDTPSGAGEARTARRHLERELDEVERDARKLERRGAAALTEGEKASLERARAALRIVARHERSLAGRLGAVLALLAVIYASLGIAQAGILALSRDFHDALSRDISLLVHVAPEDPPMRPKIRLDLPWVRRKASRRAQFFLGFLPGTLLIALVGRFVPPHKILTTVLTALWAAYWWMVMTAGQSARAWSPPETTPRPWYLRAWFWLSKRVFFFRWWGNIWERFARRFYGPCERVEEQPFEFAGLSLSRALVLVPVLKLLLRPIFSVAAAHLLVEHASTARLPVAVTAAEVADAAMHAPDPEARAHSGVAT
jgi:hypothetical protein